MAKDAQNLAHDLASAGQDAAAGLANAAREVVGAGGDVATTVIGTVAGIGEVTIDQAEKLITDLLGHLKNAATGK